MFIYMPDGFLVGSQPVTPPPPGQAYTGMAVNPLTDQVYLASCDIINSQLLSHRCATGVVTPIGEIAGSPCTIAIAIDGTGQMYGYDIVTDMLYRIDQASGATVRLVPLALMPTMARGMGWEPQTDTLYMSAVDDSLFPPEAQLRIVDRATGNTQFVGVLGESIPGGDVQLPFLAIATKGGYSLAERRSTEGAVGRTTAHRWL